MDILRGERTNGQAADGRMDRQTDMQRDVGSQLLTFTQIDRGLDFNFSPNKAMPNRPNNFSVTLSFTSFFSSLSQFVERYWLSNDY
jgi:hypothetical protein